MGCWDFGLVWFGLFEGVGFGGRVILAVLLGGKRTNEMFEVDGIGKQGKAEMVMGVVILRSVRT